MNHGPLKLGFDVVFLSITRDKKKKKKERNKSPCFVPQSPVAFQL